MADEERTEDLSPDGELLPNREVMSIIPPPDLGGLPPLPGGGPDPGVITPSPTELPGTDAAASGSGEETASSENQSVQGTQTDTATSDT